MIETRAKKYKTCQVNQGMSASTPILHWKQTTKLLVQIHIDFAGPYLGKMYLVLTDCYSKWMNIYNMWVFVYELSGCGFESCYSHLNFRYRVCFKQRVSWHSGNYRVWIHSKTRTWHNKNIHWDKNRLMPYAHILLSLMMDHHLQANNLKTLFIKME